jgi:hypothetical protein
MVFLKGCPVWGANPGPLDVIYFLIFTTLHTAEPQRLPCDVVIMVIFVNICTNLVKLAIF